MGVKITGDQRVILGCSIGLGDGRGAGELKLGYKERHKEGEDKGVVGELERGLQHQPRNWCVIGRRIGDLNWRWESKIRIYDQAPGIACKIHPHWVVWLMLPTRCSAAPVGLGFLNPAV